MLQIDGVYEGDLVVDDGLLLRGVVNGMVRVEGGETEIKGVVRDAVRVIGGDVVVEGVTGSLNIEGGSVTLRGVAQGVKHRGGTLLIAEGALIGASQLRDGEWVRLKPGTHPGFSIPGDAPLHDVAVVGLPR